MEMYGTNNTTFVGIEPDLITAVAVKLGLKAKFSNGSFDGLIPSLNANRYDVLASSFGNFVEREKVTNMVSIMGAGVAGIVRAGSQSKYPNTTSLCGTKVGVQNGSATTPIAKSISQKCQKDGKPAVQLSVFPTDTAGMVALQSQRIDLMFDDRVIAQHLASTQHGTYQMVLPNLAVKFDYAFVVSKKDPQLAAAIAWAVNALIADGTYTKIMDKYGISGSTTLLKKATVNSGTASENSI